LDLLTWSHSGSEFAIGSHLEIYILKNPSFEIKKTLVVDAKVRKLEYSRAGYLAAIDENGIIYVYNDSNLLFKRGLDNPIWDCSWDPVDNGMFLVIGINLYKG
jgi:hypothetical protein